MSIVIKQTPFEAVIPMLRILWPHIENPRPIDNLGGKVALLGSEYPSIVLRCFVAYDGDRAVGTAHFYTSGDAKMRMRGIWVDPECRGRNIGTDLVLRGIDDPAFGDCDVVYGFIRAGAEHFYERMGFRIDAVTRHIHKGVRYAEKELV